MKARALIRGARAMHPSLRWSIVLVGVVVGLELVAIVAEALLGGASPGPAASSYTTDRAGTAAFAELLDRNGHDVERLREAPSGADLDPRQTLFILLPEEEVTTEDELALARFVDGGGRLVVAVEGNPGWLGALVTGPPTWAPAGFTSARPFVPVAETMGTQEVVGRGTGTWSDAGSTLPILGGDRPTVTVASSGDGKILFLADPSVVQNEFLDDANNAAFALALAGAEARPAAFAETFHGYARGKGFAALPSDARWTLLLLALVAGAGLLSAGRRFGPPDRHRRHLAPARRAYVDALATSLTKMKDKDAVLMPLRARARSSLARRLGVPEGASDDELLHAAEAEGIRGQIDALLKPARNEQDVVEIGRAAMASSRRSS